MSRQSKNKEARIDAARLRSILSYDATTGVLRWVVTLSPFAHADSVAGYVRADGYRAISIDGHLYSAHRLAWLHATGEWPVDQIDHVDGERDNNRFGNLREATKSLNSINQRVRSDCLSGLKGVQKHKNKWAARIVVGGVRRRIGLFDTPETAHAAYLMEAKKHFGEFARAS
jgi:hypothetical protein